MAKKYATTFHFSDGTTSTVSMRKVLADRLREAMYFKELGEPEMYDKLLDELALHSHAYITQQNTLPQGMQSRLPEPGVLAEEKQALIDEGHPKSKCASILAKKYHVQPQAIRRRINKAEK